MEPTSAKDSQSQPLHNFDLLNLKWNTDGGNSSGSSQIRRRTTQSPAPPAPPVRRSPPGESFSAPPPRLQIPVRGGSFKPPSICERYLKSSLSQVRDEPVSSSHSSLEAEGSKKKKKKRTGAPIEFRGNTNYKNYAFGTMRNCPLGIDQKKPKETEVGNSSWNFSSGSFRSPGTEKLPIQNHGKNNNPVEVNPVKEPLKIRYKGKHGGKDEVQGEGKIAEIANEETRVWDLRPRNPKQKTNNTNVGEKEMKEKEKKKEKKTLSITIPLSRAEIEEDIYALSGSKPSRRPKKRARNIQKNLDSVFPGLGLVSITPESYKVSEKSLKG